MTSSYLEQLSCPRCGHVAAEDQAYYGCPACRADDVVVNLQPDYRQDGAHFSDDAQRGLFRYRPVMPLRAGTVPVSLEEGATPLLDIPSLAADVGVARLLVKDESRNPTWSYKDRLAAVAITKAREFGADTVVVSTTGNHGAAAAAYAAAAGLRCVVLTLESVPETMKVLMQALGAEVVALREGPQRWALMAEAVAKRGWVPLSNYHDPPMGSNPFGVEGYKTIAYELIEQLGGAPDVVVVPAAYGDGLAGIQRGFSELVVRERLSAAPRMVAAEPFGPYRDALSQTGDVFHAVKTRPTVMFSIATPMPTYQGVHALRASRGTAVTIADDETVLNAQLRIGTTSGLYLEASAAATLPAAAMLARNGWIRPEETVVLIGSSSGLKDIAATGRILPPVPVIDPDLSALERALEGSTP